jgi:hypothetical protein
MDEEAHTLTPEEAAKEIHFAMHMRVGKIKMGRQTWRDAMLERGLTWFAQEIAEQLRLSNITLVRGPPAPPWCGRIGTPDRG